MTLAAGGCSAVHAEARALPLDDPTADPAPLVVARQLTMAYRGPDGEPLSVLGGVNLAVRHRELVAVVGPSGCGKSTLLRILAGLQEPTSGTVTIDRNPARQAREARAIGLVLQESALLPWRNAVQNVCLGLEVNRSDTIRWVDRATRQSAAIEALHAVGLAGFESYYPAQLSGGMRQRVALARALVLEPRLLLLDEPFAAVDEITRSDLGHQLLAVWAQSATTTLLVTHSVAEAVLLADRVVVLTPRPARVSAEIAIDLPRPRPLDVNATAEFARQVGVVKAALRLFGAT